MNIFKCDSAELGAYLSEAVTSETPETPGDLSIAWVVHPDGTFVSVDKKGRTLPATYSVGGLTQAPELSRAALVFYEGEKKCALEWAKASDGLWRLAQE